MDDDTRLNAQLKSLGKKLFQFRDLVSKIDIPESIPPEPHDRIFWETFVKKCTAAMTVIRQIHSALTPDMYHLSIYPGEKIWRNPAAVPDLLGMPEKVECSSMNPIATTPAEINTWNTRLEEANRLLEETLNSQRLTFESGARTSSSSHILSNSTEDIVRIEKLFSMTSAQRRSLS